MNDCHDNRDDYNPFYPFRFVNVPTPLPTPTPPLPNCIFLRAPLVSLQGSSASLEPFPPRPCTNLSRIWLQIQERNITRRIDTRVGSGMERGNRIKGEGAMFKPRRDGGTPVRRCDEFPRTDQGRTTEERSVRRPLEEGGSAWSGIEASTATVLLLPGLVGL